jgi:hypothetical protein
MGKKSRSESGISIPDHISESLEIICKVKKKLFYTDPDPGSGIFFTWIRDGKILGYGIWDKYPGSAGLLL